MTNPMDVWAGAAAERVRWRVLHYAQQHRPAKSFASALENLQLDLPSDIALTEFLAQRAMAEANPAELIDALGLQPLAAMFGFDRHETAVLAFFVQLELDHELSKWLDCLDTTLGQSWHTHLRAMAYVLDLGELELSRMMSPRAALARSGVVDIERCRQWLEQRFDVRERVIEYCASSERRIDWVTDSYFARGAAATLTLADYDELAEPLARVLALLKLRERGSQVLLYGPPGTGKTQLASTLAAALGCDLYTVPCQDDRDQPIEHYARLTAFARAQLVLAQRTDALLLFDEVEDVVRSSGAYRDGKHRAVSFKGWLHEQLEFSPVPSLWISNSLACFDEAQLRRFAAIVEVPVPGIGKRRRMVSAATADLGLGADDIEILSRRSDVSPGELSAVTREARACSAPAAAFLAALDARLRASGRPRRSRQLPSAFDLRFSRTEPALPMLVDGIARLEGARVLMFGPPGVGKTALAAHMAERLQRPLLVKLASDLLSKWVGETEQLLAEAFDEARRDDAVLLLDEADSFFGARNPDSRSWERTQVNELLKQMEHFDGWFFAATNMPDTIDPAALRRFDFKLRFDWLDIAARQALVDEFFARFDVAHALGPAQIRAAIEAMPYLVPGDLASIVRRARAFATGLSDRTVLAWLQEEQAHKPESRRRAIGFARVA